MTIVESYLLAVIVLLLAWNFGVKPVPREVHRCWLCKARFLGEWGLRMHMQAAHPVARTYEREVALDREAA